MMTHETPAERDPAEMAREMLAAFWRRAYADLTRNGAPEAMAADALLLVAIEKRCAVEGPIALSKALLTAASGIVAASTGVVMSEFV